MRRNVGRGGEEVRVHAPCFWRRERPDKCGKPDRFVFLKLLLDHSRFRDFVDNICFLLDLLEGKVSWWSAGTVPP